MKQYLGRQRKSSHVHSRKSKGFTLLEIMIVVVIIGVLAAIAIPTYQDHVLRSNRTEGQALLVEAAARQERFFTQNNRYAATVGDLGYSTANSANNLYQLNIALTGGNMEFTLTAQPINSQTRDTKCGNLGLTHTGSKTATGASAEDCWK